MKLVKGLLFLIFILSACRTGYRVNAVVMYPRPAEEVEEEDQEIAALITPYQEELQKTMNEVIGHLNVDLVKESPESNMGNWLADMMLDEARGLTEEKIDFAIQNQGGMRINSLASGPITTGEIFELMPFDNLLFILRTDGKVIRRLMNHMAASGGWPVSEGVRFEIHGDVARNITIYGEPLDTVRMYRFAVPDYVANGGSGSFFLLDCERIETGVYVRDAFLDHIRADDALGLAQEPYKEGRIIISGDE